MEQKLLSSQLTTQKVIKRLLFAMEEFQEAKTRLDATSSDHYEIAVYATFSERSASTVGSICIYFRITIKQECFHNCRS